MFLFSTFHGTAAARFGFNHHSNGDQVMKIATVFFAGTIGLVFAAPGQLAAQKGGGSGTLGGSNNLDRPYTAPGQQMINERTRATAPGKSYDAPGQERIRARTPGPTKSKSKG
jgi:hypothetical protein